MKKSLLFVGLIFAQLTSLRNGNSLSALHLKNVLLLASCLVLIINSVASAETAAPKATAAIIPKSAGGESAKKSGQTEPTKVKVGLYLLNITDFETRTGMFTADYYLEFTSPKNEVDPSDYELMNGAVLSKVEMSEEPTDYQYRIRSRMMAKMDFHLYPFDRHKLLISLEDQLMAVDELEYVVDLKKSGIDSEVWVPGWELSPSWEGQVINHTYDIYDETYSRYCFQVTVSRQVVSVVFKSLFPALLVTIGGFFSFLLGRDKFVTRLTVLTASQIASVILHLNISANTPPVGYMTFADLFMFNNYLALIFGIGLTSLAVYFHELGRTKAIETVTRLTFYVPMIWGLLQMANVIYLMIALNS